MPHVKRAFERYKTDDSVAFVLVSLDDDPKRLSRYLEEQKFAMIVARGDRKIAEQRFNVTDVPAFFYIDRGGVIRYEARGLETHGEAADRVAWYIEELKRRTSP